MALVFLIFVMLGVGWFIMRTYDKFDDDDPLIWKGR
jgi:hypothetical protein